MNAIILSEQMGARAVAFHKFKTADSLLGYGMKNLSPLVVAIAGQVRCIFICDYAYSYFETIRSGRCNVVRRSTVCPTACSR
jgi:hypothetical protein